MARSQTPPKKAWYAFPGGSPVEREGGGLVVKQEGGQGEG
jgi:hypothetical protein